MERFDIDFFHKVRRITNSMIQLYETPRMNKLRGGIILAQYLRPYNF